MCFSYLCSRSRGQKKRTRRHTHIKGLGLDAQGNALPIGNGLVGQERAREAAGVASDPATSFAMCSYFSPIETCMRKSRKHAGGGADSLQEDGGSRAAVGGLSGHRKDRARARGAAAAQERPWRVCARGGEVAPKRLRNSASRERERSGCFRAARCGRSLEEMRTEGKRERERAEVGIHVARRLARARLLLRLARRKRERYRRTAIRSKYTLARRPF